MKICTRLTCSFPYQNKLNFLEAAGTIAQWPKAHRLTEQKSAFALYTHVKLQNSAQLWCISAAIIIAVQKYHRTVSCNVNGNAKHEHIKYRTQHNWLTTDIVSKSQHKTKPVFISLCKMLAMQCIVGLALYLIFAAFQVRHYMALTTPDW